MSGRQNRVLLPVVREVEVREQRENLGKRMCVCVLADRVVGFCCLLLLLPPVILLLLSCASSRSPAFQTACRTGSKSCPVSSFLLSSPMTAASHGRIRDLILTSSSTPCRRRRENSVCESGSSKGALTLTHSRVSLLPADYD